MPTPTVEDCRREAARFTRLAVNTSDPEEYRLARLIAREMEGLAETLERQHLTGRESESSGQDYSLLVSMLIAAQDAANCASDLDEQQFSFSRLHQNAASRSLEHLSQNAARVSREFRDAHPEVPWGEMTGMETHLAYEYSSGGLRTVWGILRGLPIVIDSLRHLIHPTA